MDMKENMPNVWGEGMLFAFSGMDGETCEASGMVLTAMPETFSWLIHLPIRRILSIEAASSDCTMVSSDVLMAEGLFVSFSHWHTVIGRVAENSKVGLRDENGVSVDDRGISESSEDVLVLLRKDDRFSLAYGKTQDQARQRAESGLTCDCDRILRQRMEFLLNAPKLQNERFQKLLYKLFSVMKVNSLSGEGSIPMPWSTPDRVPHKAMWLWDSVFHSLGMNRANPELAETYVRAVLANEQPDGMIPHCIHFDGRISGMTQPPILSWGVWENYNYLRDTQKLLDVFPLLEKYLNWNIQNRDQNGNMLFEWHIEGNPRCRCGESGMDNSPRFDEAIRLDAVDFSVFMAHDAMCLSRIAEIIGKPEKAEHWRKKARAISSQIHDVLWNTELNFYCDRHLDGTFSPVQAVSGFLPLLLDDIPQERIDALVEAMTDSNRFAAAFPLPSVALCETTWSTDMWRGATWINYNYLVILGLEKHGRHQQALALARKTVEMVNTYYEAFGVVFEYYDAKNLVPPTRCDRKGPAKPPYDIRVKMDSIRDYHWTAALTALLLLDYDKEL